MRLVSIAGSRNLAGLETRNPSFVASYSNDQWYPTLSVYASKQEIPYLFYYQDDAGNLAGRLGLRARRGGEAPSPGRSGNDMPSLLAIVLRTVMPTTAFLKKFYQQHRLEILLLRMRVTNMRIFEVISDR